MKKSFYQPRQAGQSGSLSAQELQARIEAAEDLIAAGKRTDAIVAVEELRPYLDARQYKYLDKALQTGKIRKRRSAKPAPASAPAPAAPTTPAETPPPPETAAPQATPPPAPAQPVRERPTQQPAPSATVVQPTPPAVKPNPPASPDRPGNEGADAPPTLLQRLDGWFDKLTEIGGGNIHDTLYIPQNKAEPEQQPAPPPQPTSTAAQRPVAAKAAAAQQPAPSIAAPQGETEAPLDQDQARRDLYVCLAMSALFGIGTWMHLLFSMRLGVYLAWGTIASLLFLMKAWDFISDLPEFKAKAKPEDTSDHRLRLGLRVFWPYLHWNTLKQHYQQHLKGKPFELIEPDPAQYHFAMCVASWGMLFSGACFLLRLLQLLLNHVFAVVFVVAAVCLAKLLGVPNFFFKAPKKDGQE